MTTNITTIRKKNLYPYQNNVFVFQQATPDNWGDGEPPSPIEFYDNISFYESSQTINIGEKKNKPTNTCPCGGGMTCIVDMRTIGDWVMEDEVFRSAKCSLRKNCLDPMTDVQIKLMKKAWKNKK
tara:strand:- start:325 stop:699 length:375 start_codon:yes stop_codon:yes gene_type:complete